MTITNLAENLENGYFKLPYFSTHIYAGQRERSPDYQKLRARVTHIWGNRKGQPNRSAMERPHPGGTAFQITVTPTPGKYALRPTFNITSNNTTTTHS